MVGESKPHDVLLTDFGKESLTFGRLPENDILIDSAIVSAHHGSIRWTEQGMEIADNSSTNGIYVNGTRIFQPTPLKQGDAITFEAPSAKMKSGAALLEYGVVMVISQSAGASDWSTFRLAGAPVTIGRDEACDIVLSQVSVSRFHARIEWRGNTYVIFDTNSTNGVFVNGARVSGGHAVSDRDVIFAGGARMFYSRGLIHYAKERPSIGVDVVGARRVVPIRAGKKTILDDVSFSLKPQEFIAIIGGSGAGKSTLMNGMCGFTRFTGGHVLLDGEDLYRNYGVLKNLIGYVPQQDIVHKDLTLRRMLSYTAEMRMPQDASAEERRKRVAEVIAAVELTGLENSLIRDLSGGQRKRASIAVELVSDPTVFFLDEPSSGLDPGTERNLMHTLKGMTKQNKTVIVITHMTLNIDLCDKVLILGTGGKLCFFGTPQEALAFFQVENVVDIYEQINIHAAEWQEYFASVRQGGLPAPMVEDIPPTGGQTGSGKEKNRHSGFHQFGVLSRRYLALIAADKKRLAVLLLQAPLLGLLLALVSYNADASGAVTVFKYSGEAKAILFSLSCAAFWVGMLNSVQEICKERDIFKRERLALLKLGPYLASKLVVLGALCLIQSLLLVAVVGALVGLPESAGIGVNPVLGMYATTFLTSFSAVTLGLAVSCASPDPDRAMTLAPLILMPQILFSGIAFQLSDFSAFLSGIINCRWSVRAFCVLANINALPANADSTGTTFEDVVYTASAGNLWGSWTALAIIMAVCVGLSILPLSMEKAD
jgi:ABC-type multidrug transport system ATPase subunit/pSer/pThr/pTyr-binding forkhead associated (FHA) protein